MLTNNDIETRPQVCIYNHDIGNVIGGGVVHLPWMALSKGQQYVWNIVFQMKNFGFLCLNILNYSAK